MDFLNLIGLEGLGYKVAIIALIVAAMEKALKKLGEKVPALLVNYLPLISAFALELLGNVILTGETGSLEDVMSVGFTAYSIGTIFAVAIGKILRGEKVGDALIVLVTGIAENILRENSVAEITEITEILRSLPSSDEKTVKTNIISILKKAAKAGVSDSEISNIAEIILLSAKNVKKEK